MRYLWVGLKMDFLFDFMTCEIVVLKTGSAVCLSVSGCWEDAHGDGQPAAEETR